MVSSRSARTTRISRVPGRCMRAGICHSPEIKKRRRPDARRESRIFFGPRCNKEDTRAPMSQKREARSDGETDRVFDDTHYNSNDGIMTGIWGPSLWHTLHCIGSNFPWIRLRRTRSTTELAHALRQGAPCRYCGRTSPRTSASGIRPRRSAERETFNSFIYHSTEVNTMLGKETPRASRTSGALRPPVALSHRRPEGRPQAAQSGARGAPNSTVEGAISIVPKSSTDPPSTWTTSASSSIQEE